MIDPRPFKKAFFIALAVFLLFSAFPAQAQEDTNIAKLESIFINLLDQYAAAFEGNGTSFVREGRIMVEPGEGYYAVTLPHISLKQSDGSRTDIGMIAINALPGDTPEQWKMTIAWPTPIIYYDKTGAPEVTITIGSQSFAGIWHKKINNFIKMNLHHRDIGIKIASEQVRVEIPDLKMIYDLNENDTGLWSGPADLLLSGMQIYFDRDGATGHIGELTMKSVVRDYSIDAAASYQQKIEALAESYEAGDTPSISGSHIMGLYNLIFDFMSTAWDGFDFDIDMKNFVLTRPPILGAPAGHLKIDSGHYGFNMNGFRSGLVSMGMDFAYNGFGMAPITEEYNQATPDHANISLRINNLPYKEIVELGRSSIQSVASAPQSKQMIGLQAIVMVPQLLTQAQTNMSLENTNIGNDHYSFSGNAVMTANLNAAMGMTGNAKAEISGLDNLIENLNKAAANPDIDPSKKKNIQDTLSTLAIIKMIGQMGKDAQGRDIRSYDFQLNEQGQAMLNGTDLQMLMQSTKDQ